MREIDWGKVITYGVGLGFVVSTLYLLLVIAAALTK